MRAVLDPNILISALLARSGARGEIVARWLVGELELVVSGVLLDELERALAYPKLRGRIPAADAGEFLVMLAEGAIVAVDPSDLPRRSPDPGDDYLLALAEAERAVLVSGDQHVLGLSERFPIFTPRAFLDALQRGFLP